MPVETESIGSPLIDYGDFGLAQNFQELLLDPVAIQNRSSALWEADIRNACMRNSKWNDSPDVVLA